MDEEDARLFCERKINENNRAKFDSFNLKANNELEELREEKIRICIIDIMVKKQNFLFHFFPKRILISIFLNNSI